MSEGKSNEDSFDNRNFKSDIVENIRHLFNVTCFCETDLNMKITMKTPGRTYSKLRNFKFNFNYLFNLSAKRKEIDNDIKTNVRVWLDMDVPIDHTTGNIDVCYIKAGLKLFSMYSDELQKTGMIIFK